MMLSRTHVENFVAELFKGKTDRGGVPYIQHCKAVANGLPVSINHHCVFAALCHDVIEDIEDGRQKMLDFGLNSLVVRIVELVTKVEGESYDEYKAKVMSTRESMLIKLADLKHNMDITRLKKLTDKDCERLKQYHEFYHEISEALKK